MAPEPPELVYLNLRRYRSAMAAPYTSNSAFRSEIEQMLADCDIDCIVEDVGDPRYGYAIKVRLKDAERAQVIVDTAKAFGGI